MSQVKNTYESKVNELTKWVYTKFLYTKYLYEYIGKHFCVNIKIARITIQMIVNFHREGEQV